MSLVKSDKTVTEKLESSKNILDEETYTKELENIIEKDFFPDLPKLKAQIEYLDALQTNDAVKLREIQVKYCPKSNRPGTSLSSLCNTPSTFETPISKCNKSPERIRDDENNDEELESKNKEEKKVSLDEFLQKYTSEDNASFEVIKKEAEKQHKQKYPWLYKDEYEENSKLRTLLAIPPNERKEKDLALWSYRNMNALMYVPDGCELTPEEKLKYAKQQEVVHVNSRYQTPPFNDQINKAVIAEAASVQAKMKEGKVGIDGKEILPDESPKINGYSFVATPSPAPGVCESPLMTWGEIEGTPFRLDGSNTPLPQNVGGPQFKIPDLPARERIALSLADKVAKQHRTKKREAMQRVHSTLLSPSNFRTNTPKTPVERLNSMSPAAQQLACSKLGINRGTDKALRASYSPSPIHSSSREKTPLHTPSPTISSRSTPVSSERLKKTAPEEISLTDNLLKLPKRPKASDFF
ncbi:splicing factor ESS-2 homolog [Centruroides vittatus]|uniref:splicing factor ESS-2 homolog n=1 Tax=Centruroides vittatus TaxID=120091 RepID=UPI00351066EC